VKKKLIFCLTTSGYLLKKSRRCEGEMRKLPERRKDNQQAQRDRLGPERVPELLSACAPEKPAVVQPISPARYKVAFTASAELHDKLGRLRELMRSSVPDGNLASIIEQAVTEKLERLESKRFAKTKAPRKSLKETDTSPSSRYIPAAVKRAVYKRDKGRCTFEDRSGRRCTERNCLEFHHQHRPYARGGDHSVDNVQLACSTHNGYLAERDYGKEVIERHKKNKRSASCVSEPAAIYDIENRAYSLSTVQNHRWGLVDNIRITRR
jgi:5-methylcytosine-specific restriction endonuclease McrA